MIPLSLKRSDFRSLMVFEIWDLSVTLRDIDKPSLFLDSIVRPDSDYRKHPVTKQAATLCILDARATVNKKAMGIVCREIAGNERAEKVEVIRSSPQQS